MVRIGEASGDECPRSLTGLFEESGRNTLSTMSWNMILTLLVFWWLCLACYAKICQSSSGCGRKSCLSDSRPNTPTSHAHVLCVSNSLACGGSSRRPKPIFRRRRFVLKEPLRESAPSGHCRRQGHFRFCNYCSSYICFLMVVQILAPLDSGSLLVVGRI